MQSILESGESSEELIEDAVQRASSALARTISRKETNATILSSVVEVRVETVVADHSTGLTCQCFQQLHMNTCPYRKVCIVAIVVIWGFHPLHGEVNLANEIFLLLTV